MLILAVPLPELPPAPALYAISNVTLGGIVACGVGMVAFVVMVLLVMRSEALVSRRSTFVLLGSFLVVGVGGLGVGYFSDKANRQSASEAADEYWPLKIAAIAEVTTDLERAYGVTFEEYTTIPVTLADGYLPTSLTFADGHAEKCFVVPRVEGYELSCGGITPETATTLAPVQ